MLRTSEGKSRMLGDRISGLRGIASVVAGCTTHPLDLIKVRMQLQGEKHEGGARGYRCGGVAVAIAAQHLQVAIAVVASNPVDVIKTKVMNMKAEPEATLPGGVAAAAGTPLLLLAATV